MLAVGQGLEGLSRFDLVCIWLNWGGAFMAIIVNYAAMKSSTNHWRIIYSAIGALATLYAIAYAVLVFGPFTSDEWTSAMRGLSVIVWPLVWSGPGLLRLYTHSARKASATKVLTIVEEKLRESSTSTPKEGQQQLPLDKPEREA